MITIEFIGKFTFSLGPSLTLYSLFHPQCFECIWKAREIEYHFMKLGIDSERFAGSYFDMAPIE
jgi:hypothetical protein